MTNPTVSPSSQSSPKRSAMPRRIGLVAAVAANGVIGRDGTLPWHLPADLKYFKALTSGSRIIMGRRTWESFPRPLPNREHVVISSQNLALPEGVLLAHGMRAALELPGATETVYVIGGHQAYQDALAFATDVYLTEIDADVVGDTTFPNWQRADYAEVSCETQHAAIAGLGDHVAYHFVHYQRRSAKQQEAAA